MPPRASANRAVRGLVSSISRSLILYLGSAISALRLGQRCVPRWTSCSRPAGIHGLLHGIQFLASCLYFPSFSAEVSNQMSRPRVSCRTLGILLLFPTLLAHGLRLRFRPRSDSVTLRLRMWALGPLRGSNPPQRSRLCCERSRSSSHLLLRLILRVRTLSPALLLPFPIPSVPASRSDLSSAERIRLHRQSPCSRVRAAFRRLLRVMGTGLRGYRAFL